MIHSPKKEVERAEVALHRMRVKAAALLAPESPKQSSYVYRVLRHRETGVRVRVLDTQAPDAPEAPFELPLRYVVECESHGGSPQSYASLGAAMGAARRPWEWCERCAQVMGPRPNQRTRPYRGAEHEHRHGMRTHGAAHARRRSAAGRS